MQRRKQNDEKSTNYISYYCRFNNVILFWIVSDRISTGIDSKVKMRRLGPSNWTKTDESTRRWKPEGVFVIIECMSGAS